MTRCERRAQVARAKDRARRMIRAWGLDARFLLDDPAFIGRRAGTRQPCSCGMCSPSRMTGLKPSDQRRLEQAQADAPPR